ncbi:GMC oxidoreductase [Streptomyces sp. M10(2022)]
MHPEDFRAGDFGHGRNWPLGYDDIEPYYRAAEREIGVSGDAEEQHTAIGLPFPDGYRFPMRAIPQSYLDQVMTKTLDGSAVQDPGADDPVRLQVVTTPHARNGLPNPSYDGGAGYRPAPVRTSRIRGCCARATPAAYRSARPRPNTPLKTQTRWGPSVTLVTQAIVTRVRIGTNGRATGVEYQSYRDDTAEVVTRSVDAHLVVLAAHAIENAKLLLASEAANSSDQVGRNLMDHPVLLTWGLMPQQVGAYRGLARPPVLRVSASVPPVPDALRSAWRSATGAGRGPRGRPTSESRNSCATEGPMARAFSERNCGSGSATGSDANSPSSSRWNRTPIRRTASPSILATATRWATCGRCSTTTCPTTSNAVSPLRSPFPTSSSICWAQRTTSFEPGPDWPGYFEFEGRPYAYRAAGHGAGTHIMGDSPATSVVDGWQRCWDHPNLYAVGCGSMPSVATSNPSLTMAALALRSSEEMHRDLLGQRRIASAAPSRSVTFPRDRRCQFPALCRDARPSAGRKGA